MITRDDIKRKKEVRIATMIGLLLALTILSVLVFSGKITIIGLQMLGMMNMTEFTQDVSWTITSNESIEWELEMHPEAFNLKQLSLDGVIEGDGAVSAYLVTDGRKYLIFHESGEEEKSMELITGLATRNETNTTNTTYNNETHGKAPASILPPTDLDNRSIDMVLAYQTGTRWDADNDGTAGKRADAVDMTVEDTVFSWDVDETKVCTIWKVVPTTGARTTLCSGNAECCALSGVAPTEENWNAPFYVYYEQYNTVEENRVEAQVMHLETDYSSVQSGISALDADFAETVVRELERVCSESCALPDGLGDASHTIEFIVEEGALLKINKVRYGLIQLLTDNVEIVPEIKNARGRSISADIEFRNADTNELIGKKMTGKRGVRGLVASKKIRLARGEYEVDIKLNDTDLPVKRIEVHDADITADNTEFIKVDDVSETGKYSEFVEVYAIDPTGVNFTNATVTVVATGTELHKCKAWDFEAQVCNGNWELFKTGLVPGEEYTFVLTADDPGFGESINVIDVQSYPVRGGNWTVRFTTTGTDNLTIRAVSPTTWSDSDENEDLRFIELRCGDELVDHTWTGDSVFVENYNCSETGKETAKVITMGVHQLAFTFGGETEYASNLAADFRVQRGYVIIPNISTSATITAGSNYTTPTGPAFIRMVGTRLSSMGRISGGSQQNTNSFTAYILNPANITNGITFARYGTEDTNRISWEIVEYIGPSGGANEFAVRDADYVELTTGDLAVNSGSASGVLDDNDMVVFITGQATNDAARSDSNTGLMTSEWNSTSDTGRFSRGEISGDTARASYAAVEFNGSNWNVQRVDHLYSASGAWELEAISPIANVSRAFLHTQHRGGTAMEGLDELGEEAYIFNETHVRFQLEPGAGTTDQHTVAWVIENNESVGVPMRVQHVSGNVGNSGASEEDTWSQAISTIDAVNTTSIMGENARSDGGGTTHPRGYNILMLDSTSTVEMKRADYGQPQYYRFSVVQWPTAVQGNVPSEPTSITCDGGTCNTTFAYDVDINCSGSVDLDSEPITYYVDAFVMNEGYSTDQESGTTTYRGTNDPDSNTTEFEDDGESWASGNCGVGNPWDTCDYLSDGANGDIARSGWEYEGTYSVRADDFDPPGQQNALNTQLDLSMCDEVYARFYWYGARLDAADYGNFSIYDGTWNNVFMIDNTNGFDQNNTPDPIGFSLFNQELAGYDFSNPVNFSWSYHMAGGGEIVLFDNFTIGCYEIGGVDIDENRSYTTYNDVDSSPWIEIDQIDVTLNIDVYDNTGSIGNGNTYPDLFLEMYDGSGWVEVGSFSISGTGNNTLQTTNSAITTAWTSSENRDLRVKGAYFDYNSSTQIDEINYSSVWVKMSGDGWEPIGNHTESTVLVWNISDRDPQSGVDLRCSAIDIGGSDTHSPMYDPSINLTIASDDTTPPDSVTSLSSPSQGTDWIYWTWTNPGVDFSQAIIYINGTNVANTSNNYYNATGLSTETNYTITVHTHDGNGNVNDTDVSDSRRTKDTAPPASVTGLSSPSKTYYSINWNWTNPIDADFASAIIYINGTNVVNTSNNYYNALGLNQDTNYTITIHTKDISGNVNFTDVSDTVRTLLVYDMAPNVTDLLTNGTIYSVNDTVLIRAKVVDEGTIDTVRANVSMPNGSSSIISMTYSNLTARYEGSYNYTPLLGPYTATILANDTLGNLNDTQFTVFTIVEPNMTIWKYASPNPVQVGQDITYTINYTVTIEEGIVLLDFQPFEAVTNNTFEEDSPQMIETASGTLMIAYHAVSGGDNDIFIVTSENKGGNWSTPLQVTDEVEDDEFPNLIEDNDGQILIVYAHETVPGVMDIWIINSSDNGASWSEPHAATTTPTISEFEGILEQDSSDLYYLFYEARINETDAEIWGHNSTSFTSGWGKRYNLTSNTYSDYDVEVSVFNDTFYCAWAPENPDFQEIWFAKVDDILVDHSLEDNKVQITDNDIYDYETSLNVDQHGRIYIGWVGLLNTSEVGNSNADRTSNEIFLASSFDDGTSWDIRMVTDNNVSDAYPGIVQTGSEGLYYISALRNYGGDLDVTFAQRVFSPSDTVNATIFDEPPYGTTVTGVEQGGLYDGGNVTWNFPVLYSGQEGAVSFTVNVNSTVANGTVINNTAIDEYFDRTGRMLAHKESSAAVIAIDDMPPSVEDLTPPPASTVNQSIFTWITANVTDFGIIDTVLVQISIPGDGTETYPMVYNISTELYEYLFTNTTALGQYNYTIFANDTTGNVNDTETSYFFTTNDPPTTPTNLTCDGGSCTGFFNTQISLNCSNSTDPNNDTITYHVETLYLPSKDNKTDLATGFEADESGFAYQDDLYGTTSAAQATGSRVTDANCTSGSCLNVQLNLATPTTGSAISGGWNRSVLVTDTPLYVAVSFDYKLRLDDYTEPDDFIELRYRDPLSGTIMTGANLSGITGTDFNDEYTSGTISYNATLYDGMYTFDFGCYLSATDATDENGECWLDNINITEINTSNTTTIWTEVGTHPEDGAVLWNIYDEQPQTGVDFRCRAIDSGSLTFSDYYTLGGNATIIEDVNPPMWSLNVTEPEHPATYVFGADYQFNITWTDNGYVHDTSIEHNLSGSVVNESFTGQWGYEHYLYVSDLPVGDYFWRSYANDTESNSNISDTFIFQVVKADPVCNLTITPPSPTPFGVQTNASCSCSNTDAPAVLLRNGTDVTATENNIGTLLSVNEHFYNCTTPSSHNYTFAQNISDYIVGKSTTTTTLLINGSIDDYSRNITFSANATCLLNVSGSVNMTQNGSTVAYGPAPQTAIFNYTSPAEFNISCQFYSDENYTGSYDSSAINSVDQIDPAVTLIEPYQGYYNDSVGTVFFNCSATDNHNVSSLALYVTNSFNTSLTQYDSASVLGSPVWANWTIGYGTGNYTWNCLATDPSGNTGWGQNRSFSILLPINSPPNVTTISLTSASGQNESNEDLTVTYTAMDPESDPVKNTTNWYLDGNSISVLNMPFEGGSNSSTTLDYSGYSNDGTVLGAAWSSTSGYDGYGGYDFSSDSIQLVDSASLNMSGSMSILLRANLDAVNGKRVLLMKGGVTDYNYYFAVENGKIYFGNSNTDYNTTTFTIGTGQWYQLGVVVVGNVVSVYVNGTNVENMTLAAGVSPATGDIWIGSERDVGFFSDGRIDEVLIVDDALTAGQMAAFYNDRDVISSTQTDVGDIWQACVTPHDPMQPGTTACSNNLTIVDLLSPDIQYEFPTPNNGSYNITQTINISANDTHLSSIVIYVNGTLVQTCGSSPCTYALPGDGNYTFYAVANDTYSHTASTEIRDVMIDTIPPEIQYSDSTPTNGTYSESQTINITASDVNFDTIVIYVNGSIVKTCGSSPCIYNLTNDGNYTVYAVANDTVGHVNLTPVRQIDIILFIPSLGFSTTLPGEGPVNASQDGNQTALMEFNSTSNTLYNMDACVGGSGDCQNSTLPFFVYHNTGNLNLTLQIHLNATLPAMLNLKVNSVYNAGAATNVTNAPITIATGILPGNDANAWFWGDFINAYPTDSTYRQLVTNGTQTT